MESENQHIEIKPIRKQKKDEDYKSTESVREAMHKYYFQMKTKSPDKYQDRIKKNNDRYHKNKKAFQDAQRMIEQYKNIIDSNQTIKVN